MPGRIICFVCGNPGAETSIHVHQQEKGPYFPFLEHHDPPKGTRQPARDGSVDCCRVCFAFLTTQWELYERNKTPAIKRLYWLKRADNGNFTGAEMRLQGEYIAQVMGLQYQPGCYELDSALSPENSNMDSSFHTRSVNNNSRSQQYSHQSTNEKVSDITPNPFVDSALDLSTPKKKMEHYSITKNSNTEPSKDSRSFICYVCGQQHPLSYCSHIDIVQQNINEPYFPILGTVKPYPGTDLITSSGQVKACGHCKNILYQQWQAYEMSGTPVSLRTYKTPTKSFKNVPTDTISDCKTVKDNERSSFICYICGISNNVENAGLLNTLPPKSPSSVVMFFPFIRELERPRGAEPLRPDGSVFACVKCYGSLSYQWQVQEMEGVPLYHRNYSLHFLAVKGSSQEIDKATKTSDSDSVKPLNIQISMASPLQKSQDSVASVFPTTQGLLAIAPVIDSSNSSLTAHASSESLSNSPLKFHDACIDSKTSVCDSTGGVRTVPHPLQQVSVMPKRVCFLCGERCLINKMHHLCSYPARHEAKHTNARVEPFFPFLTSCEPAPKADPITEEGSVTACNICYHTLMKQWSDFEQSTNPADSNRWLRKYVMLNYSCYVCAVVCERKYLRSLSTEKFHFLKEHKAAPDSLIMDDGQMVAVCKSCAYSLMQQYAEFERMGLPMELRKYNWMQKALAMYDSAPEDESQVRL